MYLGIALNNLNDFESACQAFEKALELEQSDCAVFLNYAIVLQNRGYPLLAKELFEKSETIFDDMEDEDKEPEMLEQRRNLAKSLRIKLSN
jgi:Bardet-Biedl syndrome 4 protein